jgi:uncharacterized protein with HEPN domain
MQRDYRLYMDDILEALKKIREYTAGYSMEKFAADSKTVDAVLRNLMIIGEAAGKIPDEIRSKHPDVQWRDMAGARNIVVHEYFGVRLDVIWKIIETDLPNLEQQIRKALSQEEQK